MANTLSGQIFLQGFHKSQSWDHFFSYRGAEAKVTTFTSNYLFLLQKQNDIDKKFQKFTCRAQIANFVCSFACMTSLTSRYNLTI